MKRSWKRISGLVAGAALVAAGCGDDDDARSSETPASVAGAASSDASTSSGAPSTSADQSSSATPSPTDIDEDATFRFGSRSPIANLDPAKSTSPSTYYMYYDPMFDTLVRSNPDGTLVPGIATDWTLSDDAKTFTMTIADGRTFHDGTPIDAAAVKANLDRAINDPKSTVTALDNVQSITTEGNTVTITVEGEGARLPALLSDVAGMMVAPASFDKPEIDTAPIGSGPFKLTSFTPASTTYERWDDYYNANDTHLQGLEIVVLSDDVTRLAALRSGQIDAAPVEPGQVQEAEDAGFGLVSSVQNAFEGFNLNTNHEALGKPEVRNALMHVVDRETINTALYNGECVPTVQPYSEESFAHDPSITVEEYGDFDPEQAKQMLTDAGYADGFDLNVDVVQLPTYVKLFEVLQEELGSVGINLTARTLPPPEFLQSLISGGADAWVMPNGSGRPDALFFWDSRYVEGGAYNPANFTTPKITGFFQDAASTLDPDAQLQAIHGMIQDSLDEAPRIIPICAYRAYAAVADNVHGLTFPPSYNFEFRRVSMSDG